MSSQIGRNTRKSLLALVAGMTGFAISQAPAADKPKPKPKQMPAIAMTAAPSHPCREVTAGRLPFKFSIDGVPADGPGKASDHCVDTALAAADIQVRYDGLEIEPRLNVAAGPDAARRGGTVHFETYANYALQLERGEVRIFRKGATPTHEPLAVLPLHHGVADWIVPRDSDDSLTYVLRVYDRNGRFDETTPKALDIAHVRGGNLAPLELAGVYGGNALAIRNIPVSGGAVLVSGRGLAPEQSVSVMGIDVPVDSKGDFAIRQIVHARHHHVDVVVADKKGIVSSLFTHCHDPDERFLLRRAGRSHSPAKARPPARSTSCSPPTRTSTRTRSSSTAASPSISRAKSRATR